MKNKTQKEREEKILTEREFRENTMRCFYQDELREHDRAMRKAFQQKEEEVRREVLERLRGLLLVDDWQPLYSEALSEVDKKSLIEELEKSLKTK